MRKPFVAATLVAGILGVLMLGGCHDSSDKTASNSVAALVKSAPTKAAGLFVIDHIPSGHAIDAVVQGASPVSAPSDWCAGRVCADGTFDAWRGLEGGGSGSGRTEQYVPRGSYEVVLDAPAPRVDDDRRYLLPTGSAIDVTMLPGSRANLTLAATYNAMDHEGEHGPSRDVWFDRRIVRVGKQQALLTEGYGSDEGFSRDVKTLYFEGPHGELAAVRATSNIFFGADIWDRTPDAGPSRVVSSRFQAKRQQVPDAELIAIASSVRAATTAEFSAAAKRVDAGRICTIDPNHGTCPLDDAGCKLRAGGCFVGRDIWGDWQRSADHSVFMEFVSGSNRLFALSPEVSSLRVTTLTRAGKERMATTVTASPPAKGVRWARVLVEPHRVTALDAAGHNLETVRVDLAGP